MQMGDPGRSIDQGHFAEPNRQQVMGISWDSIFQSPNRYVLFRLTGLLIRLD